MGERVHVLPPIHGRAVLAALLEPGARATRRSRAARCAKRADGRIVFALLGRGVQDVATAALFFASKVEDTPKRAREVVFATRTVLGDPDVTSGDAQATSVGPRQTRLPWPAPLLTLAHGPVRMVCVAGCPEPARGRHSAGAGHHGGGGLLL